MTTQDELFERIGQEIGDRAPAVHTHTQAAVTGLVAALAGKRTIDPMVIAQGTNLNDVTTPGEHSQQFTAWATPELNYPGGTSPVAGRLFVGANTQRTQVTQIYIPFTSSVVEMWVRNFYSTWGTWRRLVFDNDARLSDARTPKAHTHVAADITNLGGMVYNHGDIPNGTDINTLRTPGLWAAPKTSTVSTLTNWPAQLNGTAGFLEVMWATNGLTMQKVTGYGGNAVTVQRTSLSVSNGTYTPWIQTTPPDLSAYATTAYVDSAVSGATGVDVTGVYEQNTTRRTAFMQAMGGPINTGGKAAFALRTDHGYKNMAELIMPLCRTRGIVPSTLYNPRNWARPENTGYTATDLNTWVAAGEVEVWNHGATHADASDLAALEDEIVASIAEIESSVPAAAGKVWGFAPPGVDTTTGYGGYGNGASPEKWDTAAGRLILKHHAVNNAYVPGTGYRILDGTIRDGVSHFTMDNATVAQLKGYIDTAIANRQGVQFMVHPYVVDTEGKITTAQIAEVLDYVVAKRDAGALVTLSPYQMMVADSTRVPSAPASHPLLYMSGLRNVAGDLSAGWSAAPTGVKLSRQGSTVTLALDVYRVGALSGIADILPMPLGFRPITSGYIQPAKLSGPDRTTGWYSRLGTTSPIRIEMDSGQTVTDGNRLTNVISWQTVDPIPTTLPGIPA